MKAWILYGINDLRLGAAPVPTPKNGEVLVQVKAAGICSSDIQRVYSTGAYHYPLIPGHEFSGVTSDGRRVACFPLLPCFQCESCQNHRYETCSHYSYIGSRQDGAFAEFVAVPEWNLVELPDNVTFEQAALLEPTAVALHAVKRIEIDGVVKAAVTGNGAIGRLTGAWLQHYGAGIVEVLGRNDKNLCESYDVCFEAAGTAEAFRRCIELARPNGDVVLIGNPGVDFKIEQNLYWKILRKQLTVAGIWNSRYPSDWLTALENVNNLHPEHFISHKYKFEELDQALDMMYSKREKHGRAIITVN